MVALTMIATAVSCSFMNSIKDDDDDDSTVEITSLAFGKSSLSMSVGGMDYVSVSIKPQTEQKNARLSWSYDKSIISVDTSSNWGATITAIAEGQTSLRCSCGGFDATCIVTVSGYEQGYETTVEPYIYSNTTILQSSPGVTEKVFVSLYGGDASDIDGYTWSVDNSSVASIQPTGQYCMITARESGYTRVKITHTKASYPYYMGVYVFEDATNVTYITTSNNILTMNKDDNEQTVSVSLVNGKDSSLDSSFRWQIVNQDSSDVPVGFEYNGNKAVITPLASGSCTLRVTHPDAAYPLDILCRVITVVKNVYIQPDSTIVHLNGETEQTVTCVLENIKESEYSIDDYDYKLDNYDAAEIISSVGNQVMLKGKANGSTKLLISHPKAAYAREVLLIVTGQLTDAVDASCYITTSQNYIRTKVGADTTALLVSLKGGEDGDEAGFVWSVKSTAANGTGDVIQLETPNGTAIHSRAVASTYAYGNAYITPKAEGTAVITVTHPKIVYPTEILVKVLSRDAVLEEPLYFTGSGLVRVLNGESTDYTVQLKGNSKTASDDGGIRWSIDDNRLSVAGNENVVTVTAPSHGTGSTISHLTASHNKADADKTVLVMTADDEETLLSMKALYSDKLYYNFEVGDEATVMCNAVGFDSAEEETEYDYSLFTWTVNDPTVISVTKNAYNPLFCTIKGLKSGTAKLTGSIVDNNTTYTCEFTVTVYPVGAVQTEPEVYFTTTQNVVLIGGVGKSAGVSVSAINLKSSEYPNISWTCDNPNIATVQPNGNKATVTALAEGEAVVSVTHADSQNTLKIYVRVGSEYVIPDAEPVVYIAAQDVMTMLRDDSAQKLQAMLVNYSGANTSGFSFEIDNESVATVSAQSTNGTAYIKPVGSGQAEITISHTATEITKKVLVVVGNSAEELAGFTYLTTGSNVVAIGEGNTKTVTVQVQNAESVVLDGYNWISSNPNVVDVTPNGSTAVLKGNSIGTAMITVTNTMCKYSLQIIAQCVDPIAASANPYIQLTSSVMTLTVGTQYTSITADLVGGSESDYSDFIWTTNNSSVAVVYGQNEVGKIRAMGAGTTYITVSHPKAAYSAQLLVVCDEEKASDCYISVPSSIIAMKPTDTSQTVTATLINGSATDKYNFSWSLDVYDIIDFQYSANVCTITPKQTGSVTITISHPKAAYDQQIIVNVQQYTSFAFPNESMTVTQGDVRFISMQVPTTAVTTHVEYSVENSSICSISGTKSTAQLTAVGSGTTTVKARLIATSTGVEQASSEMMVYVKEKETNAVYITSTSTITTVNKGKSQTLSATLTGTGVVSSDQYNLKWTTSDSDIVQVTGIGADGSVKGQSIYITALKPGEAVITCSHEKAASSLQFYVVVPGTAAKSVTLNKSYITLLKGSSGSPLKATIENAESSADYYDIEWTVENVGSNEVCRIMGSGQNVTVYPLNVGEATVMAQLPDSPTVAKCTVIVQAGKSLVFETNSRKVQPFHSKVVNYTVSPADAVLTWTMSADDDYFEYKDLGCDSEGNGQVEIFGIKEGSGMLACVTDGGAKGSISVRVAWDYEFALKGSTTFSITPVETKTVEFSVNPVDADIHVLSTDMSLFEYELTNNGDGTGSVLIKPNTESPNEISIRISATNPSKDNEEIGVKVVTAKFQYPKLTPKVSFVSSDGNFSRFENDTLVIGDGETVAMKFDVLEKKVNGQVKNVSFKKSAGAPNVNCGFASSDGTYQIWNVADLSGDTVNYQYRIVEAYVPYLDGNKILDWKTAFEWKLSTRYHSGLRYSNYGMYNTSRGNYYVVRGDSDYSKWTYSLPYTSGCFWNVTMGNYTKKLDPALAETIMGVDEFRSIKWFWCDGVYLDWGGASQNQPAHVWTDNVTAVYETSSDTSVSSYTQIGTLTIEFNHLGKDEISNVQIPVYYEVRKCAKNYSGS
ncbi:MAG: Ig-like domain-containing protein [Treponema sp.]|nr:Ig-like domain-containing protein [Treponema sp.]